MPPPSDRQMQPTSGGAPSWLLARTWAGLAVGLAVALWRADRVALWAFAPHSIYLVYGTWWVDRA